MADFDPDKYIAEKAQASAPQTFDPDEYLKSKGVAVNQNLPGTDSNPIPKDIFGSDSGRVGASFGNFRGVAKKLISSGYVDAKQDSDGNVLVKDKDGKWYKDENNFLGHPINWLESGAGKSLPLAGGIGGGIAGGAGSFGLGAVAGAGAGGIAGEGARELIGKGLGTYDAGAGESAKNMATEGGLMAVGEGAGRYVVSPVLSALKSAASPLTDAAGNLIKKGVSRTSEFLTGIPKEAIERLIERPSEVMGADTEGHALDVARNARQEFLDRDDAEKNAIQSARNTFRDKFGNVVVPTKDMIDDMLKFRTKFKPDAEGVGALTPAEYSRLSRMEKAGLTTREMTYPENKSSNILTSEPMMAEHPVEKEIRGPVFKGWDYELKPQANQVRDPFTHEVSGPGIVNPDIGPTLDNIGAAKPTISVDEWGHPVAGYGDINLKTTPSSSPSDFWDFIKPDQPNSSSLNDMPFTKTGTFEGDKVLRPERSQENIIGYDSRLAQKDAAGLQRFADFLDNNIKSFDQSKIPGSGDTRYQAYLRSLYRQTKDKLHTLDPSGLGAADKQFSTYATDADRLGRLENPDTMESFINNFYGKNKSIMRQSAQNIIPNSAEDIADIGASRAFTKQGPAGSEMGGRRIIGSGVGAALGTNAVMHGSPLLGALAIGSHLATSPGAHKAVIGNASKLMKGPFMDAVIKNPSLINAIENPQLKSLVQKAVQEQGSYLSNVADEKDADAERNPANESPIPEKEAQRRFIEDR